MGRIRGVAGTKSVVAWSSEVQHSDLDRFHLFNDTGLLSLPELCAAARLVWPDVAFDEDGEAVGKKPDRVKTLTRV